MFFCNLISQLPIFYFQLVNKLKDLQTITLLQVRKRLLLQLLITVRLVDLPLQQTINPLHYTITNSTLSQVRTLIASVHLDPQKQEQNVIQMQQVEMRNIYYSIFLKTRQMLEPENIDNDSLIAETVVAIALLLFLYQRHRKRFSERRLKAVRNRLETCIDSDKIILALELQGIFVDISNNKIKNYSQLEHKTSGIAKVISKLKYIFGKGLYYKPRTSIKNMKILLQFLSDNPKIDLYLYTHLSSSTAECLLKRLDLQSFFLPSRRRSCLDAYSEPLKHPTEVDFNTKRVIIVTNSHADHLQQYSKYFFVINKTQLSDSIELLNSIVENNKDIDELHNELAYVKACVESDDESAW